MQDCAKPVTKIWSKTPNIGVDGLLVSLGDQLSEPANRAALALRAAVEGAEMQVIAEKSSALNSTYLRSASGVTDHASWRS